MAQNPIDDTGNELKDLTLPHNTAGAAKEKFARLASTDAALVPIEEEAPLSAEDIAAVHETSVSELAALDVVQEGSAQEARGYAIRADPADVAAQDIYSRGASPEGSTEEVLAKVDALAARDKQRAAQPEMIPGTMSERKDSLLEQGSELVSSAAGAAGEAFRGFGETDYLKHIELNTKTVSPSTDIFDDLYKQLETHNAFSISGQMDKHELEGFLNEYLVAVSGGAVTHTDRAKFMRMATEGLATRNGRFVGGMNITEGFLASDEAVEDMANGLGIYKAQLEGRVPTQRQDRNGDIIPYTDDQVKTREDELGAFGVYDPGVISKYRSGKSKEAYAKSEGVNAVLDWTSQVGGTAFNKLGFALPPRYASASAEMVGYALPLVANIAVGNKALGLTKLSEVFKVAEGASKTKKFFNSMNAIRWAHLENTAALTDYYMMGQGKREQTIQGAIRKMEDSGQLASLKEAAPALAGVLDWAAEASRDSKYVITGDDTKDSASLKHMHSGMLFSLPLGAGISGGVFGAGVAKAAAKAAVKGVAKAAVKGSAKSAVKFSREAIEAASKKLGYNGEEVWGAYVNAQRGAAGGGKLPQFRRGAAELEEVGQEGLLDDMDHWYNMGDEARKKANRAELESILSKISQEDPAMRFDIGGQKNFDAEVTNRDILEDLKGLASNDNLTYESGWSSLTRDELENFASSIHGDDVSHAFMLSGDDFAKEVSDADIVSFIKENLKGLDKPKAPATRAGQEGFLNLDISKLWAKGKRFLDNVSSIKGNKAAAADAKATKDDLSILESNMDADELAEAKRLADSDEDIDLLPKSEGRPSGVYGDFRTKVYEEADDWNRALLTRIETDAEMVAVRRDRPTSKKGKKLLEKLSKKLGVDADKDSILEALTEKNNRATASEFQRKAAFMERGIDLDEWGKNARGKYNKKTNPSGETLEEFLEGHGLVVSTTKEGSLKEATERAVKMREELGIEKDASVGGLLEKDPDNKKLRELFETEKQVTKLEWEEEKDAALAKFLVARERYRLEKNAKDISATTKAKLEYYYVKTQQLLAKGDELDGVGTHKGKVTQSYSLPDIKDADKLVDWSRKGFNSGNFRAKNIYEKTANFRKGQSFPGEYGTKAAAAMESHLSSTQGMSKRQIRKTGARQLLANTRMMKVSSLVSAPGTILAAAMGIPTVMGRMPLQKAVEFVATSVFPQSSTARMAALAKNLREGAEGAEVVERVGLKKAGSPTEHGFWSNVFNTVFNPTSRKNVDLGGTKATGEYAAGYQGSIDVFGRPSDLQSATPLGMWALNIENPVMRNLATGSVGLWEVMPREAMGTVDRITKKVNFEHELSRQVASAFLDSPSNSKRMKNGLALNDGQLSEVYNILIDGKQAIEDGLLLEKDLKKFMRENLNEVYGKGGKEVKIHSGYSNDELIDTAMGAWENTWNRQRELTLQQDLPLGSVGRAIEGASQNPASGHNIMFAKTIGNNISMAAERFPVAGALWDMFGHKGFKGLSAADKAEIIEKQIVGTTFFIAGAALEEKFGDRIIVNKDGSISIVVDATAEEIRQHLMMSLEDNPDMMASMMAAANEKLRLFSDATGQDVEYYDDPVVFFEREGLEKLMPEGEGRAVIKAPRIGWFGNLFMAALAFKKSFDEVDHLPLNMIKEQGMAERIWEKSRATVGSLEMHDLADGYQKMFAMVDPEGQNVTSSVTDMLLAELASTFTFQKGMLGTGGEPLEFESELKRDYRAVSGLEEFMEGGGKVSLSSFMNHVWGDDHISSKYNGMMFNMERTQRPVKNALLIEYHYETNFVDEMLREAQIEVRPILDTAVLPGQNKSLRLYDYRDEDGLTAYERIMLMSHEIVTPEPVRVPGTDEYTYMDYSDSLKALRGSEDYQTLQGAIDAAMKVTKSGDSYRDDTGAITNPTVLKGLVAQELIQDSISTIRNTFKNAAASKFLLSGEVDNFVHKSHGATLSDQHSKVRAMDFVGQSALAVDFNIDVDPLGMSVEKMSEFVSQKWKEERLEIEGLR